MFSGLTPLFKTIFRQAESTDTRQAIAREEKQGRNRKKEEERPQQPSLDLWEDSTGVSVEALRSFLADFVNDIPHNPRSNLSRSRAETMAQAPVPADDKKTSTDPDADARSVQAGKNSDQRSEAIPKNTATARAVRAYQNMSYQIHPEERRMKPPHDPEHNPYLPDSAVLSPEEIRLIHTLIADLDHLAGRNVRNLTIEKAENFLQSLAHAVARAKTDLR